ncbi:MAG: dipeptidase [Bacteroidota bacterium]|nr:dipeptidase [Bacteroidota bacterium]
MKYLNTVQIIFITCLFFIGFQNNIDYRKLHSDALVVDAHNDVVQRILEGEDISKRTLRGHSDLPRLKDGGVDVQFFSIWVPPQKTQRSYFDQANEQIDSIEILIRRNPHQAALAKNASDIEKFVRDGKLVIMLGIEGGHHIADDLRKLEQFYNRGVRYMTLTWNNSTSWATSARDEDDKIGKLKRKGLNDFGVKVIRKMNDLGMIIDVSHLGETTFWDVVKRTTKPIIASHSSVWSLSHNRRNLKDDQIKAIAKTGGVVFINFLPLFIDSTYAGKERRMRERNKSRVDSFHLAQKRSGPLRNISTEEFLKDEYLAIRPPLERLIAHFDYVAKLVGVDHVGIGSDFDGISITPLEMDDVTYLPNITRELLRCGYSENEIKKILGENFIRVLKEVEVR